MNYRKVLALLAVGLLGAAPLQAKNDKQDDLPPGLLKKAQKGKPLPPGWQKKIEVGERIDPQVFKREAVVVVPEDGAGLLTVRIDGKLVRVAEKTLEIVDILSH